MINSEPLITIITLIYNTGKYVTEGLETVKKQEYKNIQHLIIDDCSSDNSVEIVSKWISDNNYNCQFIKHNKNLGISKSLNEALKNSKGEFITFIHDDLFLIGKLKRQVLIFENLSDDFGIVYSDVHLRDKDGNWFNTLLNQYRSLQKGPEGNIFEELFLGNFIHGSGALIRKQCFDEIGYFNESLIVEDIDMYLRIALKYKFKFDDKISAEYRVHDKSLLQTLGIRGLEQNLKSLEPYYKYSDKTVNYFINYLDACLVKFYFERYKNWRKWYKKRLHFKFDTRGIKYFFIALLNIKPKYYNRLKYIYRLILLKKI